jgi:hypothetical protein
MPESYPVSESAAKTRASLHWPSVLQFAFSLFSALILWGFALGLGLMVFSTWLSVPDAGIGADSLSLMLMAAGTGFSGILLLPSAWHALLRIIGRPNPIKFKVRRLGTIILLLPFVVGLGYLASQNDALTWIALPPLHVLASGISVLWLLHLGIRGLSTGSAQRAWGIFSSGLVLAPAFSLILEMGALLVAGFFGMIYLARDPVFADRLIQLSQQMSLSPDQPPDVILEFLEPCLLQPAFIYAAIAFGAILVPLIEELLKPIGVWLLAGRNATPSQGFAAGLLSGAGYALFENFALSASAGEEWSMVIIARMGTTLIHILTAGLTGWGLALAWREGRYIRLGLTYLTAVAIHALWNGLVILSIAPEILPADTSYPDALLNIGTAASFGFAVLLIGCFALLLGANSAMRHAIISPVKLQPETMLLDVPPAAKPLEEETPTNGNHQLSD